MVAPMNFYHRSKNPLEADLVLVGRGLPDNNKEIEAQFEKARPGHCLSRAKAVFMSTNPHSELHGVHGEFIYQVEPLKLVERRDNVWYGNVQKAALKKKYEGEPSGRLLAAYPDWNEETIAQNTTAYWAGTPSANPNWEYLTLEARVAELVV